jgi:acyl-CoA synthetase (AMP-forming)/AMP-acid ligase II
VDVDAGTVLGPDHEGEILLRGPLVMAGIYKRERHDTFTPDGWYATGDLGRFDPAGYLRFTGRRGAMIKSGGSNVAPAEVEAVLASLTGVREAIVFGVPAGERGEDVAAVVVAEPSAELDPAELQRAAKGALSTYKVPRHIRIVLPDAVPMLPTGKVDLGALRALFTT